MYQYLDAAKELWMDNNLGIVIGLAIGYFLRSAVGWVHGEKPAISKQLDQYPEVRKALEAEFEDVGSIMADFDKQLKQDATKQSKPT